MAELWMAHGCARPIAMAQNRFMVFQKSAVTLSNLDKKSRIAQKATRDLNFFLILSHQLICN